MGNSKRGGARRNAGRKKGIGVTYTIRKHCEDLIVELLKDEAFKNKALKQMEIQFHDPSEHIYIFKINGLFKIGYSSSIEKRIKNYRVHTPNIEVIFILESKMAFELEQILHNKFKDRNKSGEFFELTNDEVLTAISIATNHKYKT